MSEENARHPRGQGRTRSGLFFILNKLWEREGKNNQGIRIFLPEVIK